jgi:hypothetical protein
MREALTRVINMVAVVMVLYTLAYFGLAKRGATIEFAGYWASWPDYHGVPEAIFEPLQYLDATRLRPWFWAGKIPPAERLRRSKLADEAVMGKLDRTVNLKGEALNQPLQATPRSCTTKNQYRPKEYGFRKIPVSSMLAS